MRFKRSLGQHILSNDQIAATIARRAGLRPTDRVLEIGPGTGRLTRHLVPLCRSLVVVEQDLRMVEELHRQPWLAQPKDTNSATVEVIAGDALEVPLPDFDVCVANLPFNISSPFLYRLAKHVAHGGVSTSCSPSTDADPPTRVFRSALLMLQKEFADRLSAAPGSRHYARLSAGTQRFLEVDEVLAVSRGNFVPPPRVDATVVRLRPKTPLPTAQDLDEYDRLLRLCFHRKNKTLRAVLTGSAALDTLRAAQCPAAGRNDSDSSRVASLGDGPASDVAELRELVSGVLAQCGLEGKRAVQLSHAHFDELLRVFRTQGVHLAAPGRTR